MKQFKVLSLVLIMSLLLNVLSPTAYALSSDHNNVECFYYTDNIVMYGFKDSEKLANFSVNLGTMTGELAIVYSSNPDYMYEYQYNLPSLKVKPQSQYFWDELYLFCLNNSAEWSEVYIPDIVAVEEKNSDMMAAASSTTYFDNYLGGLYGSQYTDRLLNLKATSGVTMRIYEGLQLYTHMTTVYTALTTLTIASFITGMLGLVLSSGILGLFSVITGGADIILAGKMVYEYNLRANWYRYVYVNSHTYPYSMCNKFIYWTGYEYNDTGTQQVDTGSMRTDYVPSSSYFNTYSTQYDAAYLEYQRLGPIN